jgi:hypothetical protein
MTRELQTAIDHVKQFHPTLAIVIFSNDGRWNYMDTNFDSFKFDERIDVGILEDASDSIPCFPFIIDLTQQD